MESNFTISEVRVIVRVRPFLPRETSSNTLETTGIPTSCISLLPRDSDDPSSDEVTVLLKDPHTSRSECYQLDSFFGQEDKNVRQIFEREVSPLLPGLFRGCNATVFAYGATGSGKTYTMQGTDELPGLMPLAMSTILSMCQSRGSTAEISYYEVYLDRCYDLLELKANEIAILDDKDGQVHLRGLSRVPVNSMPEFQEVFARGIQRRKIAHTGLNDVSSRSHGVLVMRVSTPRGDGSDGATLTGKLNLIDLAGNEDNRRTCNEGIRLQESAKINQSLFALSNVIYALNNNMPRVPYRESKLTRILQDSLGGTSRALMVACLNPGEYQESVHTVSLAARSRHITNFVSSAQKLETPKVKVDMEAKLRAWLESKGKTKNIQRMGKSPFLFLGSSRKNLNYNSSAKAKVDTNLRASNAKNRIICVPFRNLINDEESLSDSFLEGLNSPAKGNKEEIATDSGGFVSELISESTTCTFDEGTDDKEKMTSMDRNDSSRESPAGGKKNALRSPLRKALSPINSNVKRTSHEETASTDRNYPAFFDPKTPKTPLFVACAEDKFVTVDTPLDKFNLMSSSLKSSLIQEYIHLLNTASREELLEIKGIGVKMAEYIIELRETSPLKWLSDLEKIGLSSKQTHNMFSKAARGLFDGGHFTTSIFSETFPVQ